MTLCEGQESQLYQGDQDQSVKRPSPSVTRARVEATLGKSVQLPCQCTAWNLLLGKLLRAQWKDDYGRLIDFSNTSTPAKYVLLNEVRRVKKKGDL